MTKHLYWNDAARAVLDDLLIQPIDSLPVEVEGIGAAVDYAYKYFVEPCTVKPLTFLNVAAETALSLLVQRRYGGGYESQSYDNTIGALHSLLVQRQQKYGPKNITKFGLQGILIRLSDKVERLRNLVAGTGVETADESIDDTLADVVGYYVVAKMLEQGEFELPLQGVLA